jgi:hypothetical protein
MHMRNDIIPLSFQDVRAHKAYSIHSTIHPYISDINTPASFLPHLTLQP